MCVYWSLQPIIFKAIEERNHIVYSNRKKRHTSARMQAVTPVAHEIIIGASKVMPKIKESKDSDKISGQKHSNKINWD